MTINNVCNKIYSRQVLYLAECSKVILRKKYRILSEQYLKRNT